MTESNRGELARPMLGPTGFIVIRTGDDVEVRIPSPDRFVRLGTVLATGGTALACVVWLLKEAIDGLGIVEDGAEYIARLALPILSICLLWAARITYRRVHCELHRLSETRIRVADNALWCEPADAPGTCYRWPAADLFKLRVMPLEHSLCGLILQIGARGRPNTLLKIVSRDKLAIQPLWLILEHEVKKSEQSLLKDGAETDATEDVIQYAGRSPSDPSSLAYERHDIPSIGWTIVALYRQFPDWHDARTALALLEIPAALISKPGASGPTFQLLVPEKRAGLARRWLATPADWFDRGRCPCCGEPGRRIRFLRRVLHGVLHFLEPPTISWNWRYCEACQRVFFALDRNSYE